MNFDFDNDVFKKLSFSLGEVFPEILNVFFTETESSINDLKSMIKAGKNEDVRDVAHKIKSSSKTFGATGLSDLLDNIENNKDIEQTELIDLSNAVTFEFDRVKNHIQKLL